MDCYSRRIVGWAMADHMRAELVVDALEMAVARRKPIASTVMHSDQGSQYTSLIFTQRCRSAGLDVSMGSRGDCFDSAAIESFHASLKKDLINRRAWPTKAEARTAVFEYLESFYNRRRRHKPPGNAEPCRLREQHSERYRPFGIHTHLADHVYYLNRHSRGLIKPCPPKRGSSILTAGWA